jgi:hypothetical protein
MPSFSPLLMIVPLFLSAMLCVVARMVNEGGVLAQGFEALHGRTLRRWEIAFDFLMIIGVGAFLMFIDNRDISSVQVFAYGLSFLGACSVMLVVSARTLGVVWASVVVRKIAFRTTMCLALFIVVLGMRASGLGHIERTENAGRYHSRGH